MENRTSCLTSSYCNIDIFKIRLTPFLGLYTLAMEGGGEGGLLESNRPLPRDIMSELITYAPSSTPFIRPCDGISFRDMILVGDGGRTCASDDIHHVPR